MGEIISRWSKKSLSQVINLLSGAFIMILFINHYTVIDIQLDFLNFISVNYANLSEGIIMWIFSILLFHNFIFKIVRYIVKGSFSFNTEKDELKYYNILILIHTCEDVLDLMVSIYGLIFLFAVHSIYMSTEIFYTTPLTLLTYLGIILRFVASIVFHFYYSNLSIVNKSIKTNSLDWNTLT